MRTPRDGWGRAFTWGTVGLLWAGCCVGGLAAMAGYQATPSAAAPAADWPAGSQVRLAAAGDTLVLLIHPKCPCSRATISNLAVLMAHCPPGRVTAFALFVRPTGVAAGWERTDLWESAAVIPGVTVMVDDGGAEAARFGAATSGQALLFDPAGRLRFRGGLTPGRGHAGDSAGMADVLAVANGEPADVAGPAAATPVFGCDLMDTARACPVPPEVH